MRQSLAIALEPELHLVVELRYVLVRGKRGEILVARGLARVPVSLGQDPQVHVIGIAAVRIGLREHMQSVRMQVGHVRTVYTVNMALERPAGLELRIRQHLLDLLGKDEWGAIARLAQLESADLLVDQFTDLAPRIRRDVDGVGIRPDWRTRLVEPEDIAHPEANLAVAANAYGGPGASAVVAEQGRRRVARGRRVAGTLVGDDIEFQRGTGPVFGTPYPRFLPVSRLQLCRVDQVARRGRRRCGRPRIHGGRAVRCFVGGGRCDAGRQRYGQSPGAQLDEFPPAKALIVVSTVSHCPPSFFLCARTKT
jgi:hypothetical protein